MDADELGIFGIMGIILLSVFAFIAFVMVPFALWEWPWRFSAFWFVVRFLVIAYVAFGGITITAYFIARKK